MDVEFGMNGWRSTLEAGRRRATVRGVAHSGAWGLVVAAVGVAAWAVLARGMDWPIQWGFAAVAGGVVTLAGGVIGWLRRPTVLVVANRLDAQAGHDAIASAWQFSKRMNRSVTEQAAIEAGDVAASRVDVGRAYPMDLRGPAARVGIVALCLLGAAFVPPGWVGSAARRVGLVGGAAPTSIEVAAALEDARAAEALVQAVEPRAEEQSGTASSQNAPQTLAELEKELSRGSVTPREASERAAAAVERAAEGLERRAAGEQRAHELLRDRLAEAGRSGDMNADIPAQEDDPGTALSEALRRGDLERAAQEAEKLVGGADRLSPQERARLAEELKKVAEGLKKNNAPLEKGREPEEKPGEDPLPQNASEGPDGGEKQNAQKRAVREAAELSDSIKRAADELEAPASKPTRPDAPPTARPGESSRGDEQAEPSREGQQRNAPPSGDPTHGEQTRGEQGPRDPKQSEGMREGGASGQKPAEKEGRSSEGQAPAPGERSGEQPGGEGNAGEQPRQEKADQKSGDRAASEGSKQTQGEKPQPEGSRKSDSPQGSGGERQGRDRTSESEGLPQPGPEGTREQQPVRDGMDKEGGSLPDELPENLPSMKELGERLKDLANRPKGASQDRRNAQKLREQAEKLWERATPEQRRQMEELARELAKQQGDQNADRPSGERAAGDRGGNRSPDQREETSGSGARRDPLGGGRGAGDQASGEKSRAGTSPHAGQTQDVDARTKGNLDDGGRSRVIAEWLSGRDPERTGSGSGTGVPAEVGRAVEQAQKAAERAVQERSVPSRMSPLIRKYFDRLPEAVGSKPAGDGGGRSGGDAKP